MKRIFAIAFIACYVGVLSYGNLCHLLRFRVGSHPLMYMIVWDMFCGWSAFDSRIHIIAEGESEKFYDLTPPWGVFYPYGYIGRENYDQFQSHTGAIGFNVLKHTRHEPITRVFVFEEAWPKKFNLPDSLWKKRYDDPKDLHSYFRRRLTLLPDGTVAQRYSSWTQYHSMQFLADNPRLIDEARHHQGVFTIVPGNEPGRDALVEVGEGQASPPTRAPSAQ